MARIRNIGELDWRTVGATEHRFGNSPKDVGNYTAENKVYVDLIRAIFNMQSIERHGDSRCTLQMTLLLDAVHHSRFQQVEVMSYGATGGMCFGVGDEEEDPDDPPYHLESECEALLHLPNSLQTAFKQLAIHLETVVVAAWRQPDYLEITINDYVKAPVLDTDEFISTIAQKLSEFACSG